MSRLRFEVGTSVMCNLGPDGWKLGRIIALDYREDHWPMVDAPYEVLLNDNHTLIYVPEDNSRYCREATNEDLKIAHRMDALDVLPSEVNMIKSKFNEESNSFDSSNKSPSVVNKVKQNRVVPVIDLEDAIAAIIFQKTGLMPNFTVNTTAALPVIELELLDKQLTLVGFQWENRLNTNQDKTY